MQNLSQVASGFVQRSVSVLVGDGHFGALMHQLFSDVGVAPETGVMKR